MIRKTELVTKLYSNLYGSEDLQRARKKVNAITYKDYDDFGEKYGAPNSEEPVPVAISTILYVFEEAGVPPSYRGRNATNTWKMKGVIAVKGRSDVTSHDMEIQVNP